jgi:alpha-1,6-mannosyltransferase
MHFIDITMFYAAEGGGVSTYLNAKAAWLRQCSRVRHSILSPNVRSNHGTPALVHVPGILMPGVHGYRMPVAVEASARIMLRMRPDLIEAGDAGPAAWSALRAKRRLGIPAVAYYHSDLARLAQARLGNVAMRAVRRYLAQLYGQFDMVLAPSRLMVQQLGGMGVHGAIHQPLGIDSRMFSPRWRSGALRRYLRLPDDTRLLVYAGRFTPDKKLGVLIDAVGQRGPPYHLLLSGAGTALPASPRTSVLPFMRDQRLLARMLASCDALVHPGDRETFGLIVLEAMASGLPVVGTRGGAVAELVDDSTGVLVTPNCARSLAEGIDALYRRDLPALAQAARGRASEQFDWNTIMPQLMHRYASLLALRERADLGTEFSYVPE